MINRKLQFLFSVALASSALALTPTNALAMPIQNLNGQTGQTQNFANDTNVTMSSASNTHTLGWSGVLSVLRGGTGASSFSNGSLLFFNGSTFAQNNSNLFWDNTNNRLGIGTSSPAATLDVNGSANVTSLTSTNDSTFNEIVVGKGGSNVGSNTAVGVGVLSSTSAAGGNTAVGYGSMAGGQYSGEKNTAVGSGALAGNTSGSYNAAFGNGALNYNTTGIFNTALGMVALNFNTTGDSNVAVGVGALQGTTTGSNNVAIGRDANRFVTGDNNSIVIGSFAVGAGDYTAVIGNSNVHDVYFGSSDAKANSHSNTVYTGSSTVPGCIVIGDTAGGVGYVTLNSGVLTVSSTKPSACQ